MAVLSCGNLEIIHFENYLKHVELHRVVVGYQTLELDILLTYLLLTYLLFFFVMFLGEAAATHLVNLNLLQTRLLFNQLSFIIKLFKLCAMLSIFLFEYYI